MEPFPQPVTAPAALVALLRNLVDYAGLFPPATLDMEPVVRNYAGFLTCSDHWMLERLIVPVARLDEFTTAATPLLPDPGDDAESWPISALTAPADDTAGLERDLERILAFNAEHEGRAVIETIELRAADTAAIDNALDRLPDELFPWFELPADPDPRGLLAALPGSDAGAKIRTGGVTPDLYPSPAIVARFLAACAAADVPFKATAGLHHPLRHRNESVGADEFGFLNVFVAAVLAREHAPAAAVLESILTATDLADFVFDHDRLSWRDLAANTDAVEDARLTFAVSYGSCSFDEPRDDLRALGLL